MTEMAEKGKNDHIIAKALLNMFNVWQLFDIYFCMFG